MIDFQTALKAKLPFISIQTDDPVNVKAVLQELAGKIVMPLPKNEKAPVGDTYVWWTESQELITSESYRRLCDSGATCIVVNPSKPSLLVFDAGVLPTPVVFYENYLKPFVQPSAMVAVIQVLRGLSVKTAQEVVMLTMARCGSIMPHEIRKTRQLLAAEHPGLSELDTSYDFYEWPKPLKEWLDLNDKYFLDPTTPDPLVPRGLLLAGETGTGKSMAAMVLAKHWDVPLFRLDIPTSLNRWLGESEGRIATSLHLIEQSAPCVWLLDEAEKLFGTSSEEITSRRILSQILWWLQTHKSRVLTIMTTNDEKALPPELYRAERVDRTIHLEKLSLTAAKQFTNKVYVAVIGKPPTSKHQQVMRAALDKKDQSTFAHVEVRVLVYDCIKINNWLKEVKDEHA